MKSNGRNVSNKSSKKLENSIVHVAEGVNQCYGHFKRMTNERPVRRLLNANVCLKGILTR